MNNWWENTPWRLIQTNLREIDMLDIDAAQVVADLQSFHASVLMINAAGIIASYPTELDFHFQSPYLQGDSLQQIIDACHAAQMRVFARTDFSKVRRPIYEAHPDWAYVDAAGRIVDYNGDVHVCLNGGYQQQAMFRILEEMLTKLDFDGVFFNMSGYQTRDYSGNYYGICHCDNCRRRFAAMFDLALPAAEDLEDPTFRKYVVFKNRTLREHRERVYRFVHDRWPHICIANHRDFRAGFIRQESNTAVDRPLPHWQYSGSDNTKWATSSYPAMVSSNTTVDFIDIPYRHVAVSPAQQALRLAQGLANGGSLDFYLIGRLDNHADRSGFAGIREIFAYHAAHAEAYAGLRSCAGVALINGQHANTDEFRGWFRTLAENHFLFDTLLDDTVLELPWDRYAAVVLPDFQAVSDALAARIDRFVADGGVLIASGRSGFRDEVYEPRPQPALRSLGIRTAGPVRADIRPSYFQFEDKAGFPRFAATDLVYLDGPYVYAEYEDAAVPHLRLIPPHPFGPPERCYYGTVTDHPGFVVHPYGRGRAIYLPWLPGALFHRQGYTNTWDFAADLLEHVAGVQPVAGNLSPMVEVTRFTAAEGHSELIHLVNGSGHFGVSFFPPVPMHDLRVTLPCTPQPSAVRSLRQGRDYAFSWQENSLTIEIPTLELFDAIQVAS